VATGRRASSIALVLALIVPLGFATHAAARRRKPSAPLQLQYVQSGASAPGGISTTSIAQCPAGTRVVGGGVSLSGPTTEGLVRTSAPQPIGGPSVKPKKGWIGTVRSTSASIHDLVVTAICANVRVKYVRSSAPLDEGATGSATAVCPPGTKVLGGGASLSDTGGAGRLTTSGPVPVGDPAVNPDTGWNAVALNTTGADPQRLNVVAICANLPQAQYVQTIRSVAPDADVNAVALCPAGSRVTGGGIFQSGAARDSLFTTSVSYPVGDPAADKGWIAFARNFKGEFNTTHTVVVTAICATP
jgi:hypothetical protein